MNNKALNQRIFLLVLAALLLALVLNIRNLGGFFGWIYNAISALIIGGCIAFVLNILVNFFSEKLFKNINKEKTRVTLSLILAIIVILLLFILLVLIIVPQLIQAFKLLGEKLPAILNGIQTFTLGLFNRFPEIAARLNEMKASETHFTSSITTFLKSELPNTLDKTFIVASKTVKAVMTFFIGFMVSIYIIISKKRLGIQSRELCYALFSKDWANRVLYIAHLTGRDFKAFIFGRVLDALIMAGAYLIIGLLFRLPFTLMIASIVAVFSIIPLFGALISWGVGFFLIVTVSFPKALIFSVVILLILFITRNFIYPKLIGDSIGLPDLWVLIAVVIGGKLFGLLGMITAVPIFSVLYHLLAIFVHLKIKQKDVPDSSFIPSPNWDEYNDMSNSFKKE